MKIAYTGIKHELSAKLQAKLDAKFAKLSKFLEKRGEKEAHVVVTSVRHLYKAEITIQFYDHQLVGVASDADLFTALYEALDKLESQAVKNRGKWREKHRRKEKNGASAPQSESGARETSRQPAPIPVNVKRAKSHGSRKPMTLEEAVLEMEQDRDYLVYRDAENENISVLVRRRDGKLDLIEV